MTKNWRSTSNNSSSRNSITINPISQHPTNYLILLQNFYFKIILCTSDRHLANILFMSGYAVSFSRTHTASDNSNTVDVVSKVAIICILTCQQHNVKSLGSVYSFFPLFIISLFLHLRTHADRELSHYLPLLFTIFNVRALLCVVLPLRIFIHGRYILV